MPDYHFPTCFSHKEIARLDFLSCTKWKQIEANSVCTAEESRIGEICAATARQSRTERGTTDLQFLRQMTRRKKDCEAAAAEESREPGSWNIWGLG